MRMRHNCVRIGEELLARVKTRTLNVECGFVNICVSINKNDKNLSMSAYFGLQFKNAKTVAMREAQLIYSPSKKSKVRGDIRYEGSAGMI